MIRSDVVMFNFQHCLVLALSELQPTLATICSSFFESSLHDGSLTAHDTTQPGTRAPKVQILAAHAWRCMRTRPPLRRKPNMKPFTRLMSITPLCCVLGVRRVEFLPIYRTHRLISDFAGCVQHGAEDFTADAYRSYKSQRDGRTRRRGCSVALFLNKVWIGLRTLTFPVSHVRPEFLARSSI